MVCVHLSAYGGMQEIAKHEVRVRIAGDDPRSSFTYRKRPCISRTFFHKIEAKNRGCGLSMDTSVFGVLKNLINIHKTS